MKIPGFGGGATNANKVDFPPANMPGKTGGTPSGKPDLPDQPGKSSLPFLNNAKTGPLNFASNAFDGLSTLASLTGSGGSQKNGQSNGANSPDAPSGGGLLQQIMMLTGLQQLLGGGNKAQQPEQPATPAPSQGTNHSSNPLEQLMQMLQQLLQQMMGVDKGKGADSGESGGNAPQAPAQGATDNAGQQGGMMQNLLSMLGLTSLLQGLLGSGEGQSSQKNTQS
ncbi:hypothetical protein SAMN05428971_1396 [Candidatus Pantoea varia]|uniref:Uncharacterized protein n=1 Tax=Candidatus Pantoea varia TaxID=1881036 RepID=A0A1I4YXD2_9GAMM|nr:hypothetical protein [Pantoea varia]SFN42638.1 hypothetical protein SAMN05428971_1396 [Pantoea varia]